VVVVEDLEVVLTLAHQEILHQHHHHKETMVGMDFITLAFLPLVVEEAVLEVLANLVQMQTHHLLLLVGLDLHPLLQAPM